MRVKHAGARHPLQLPLCNYLVTEPAIHRAPSTLCRRQLGHQERMDQQRVIQIEKKAHKLLSAQGERLERHRLHTVTSDQYTQSNAQEQGMAA